MNWFKKYNGFLLLCLIIILLCGCGGTKKEFSTKEDFEKAKIGVLSGSSFNVLADINFPNADIAYLMNLTDLVLNLKQNKIDGILIDEALYTPLKREEKSLTYIKMDMEPTQYAVALPNKNESIKLKNQFNEFIKKLEKNGEALNLKNTWVSNQEPNVTLDFSSLSGENGTLKVATTVECKPFNYLINNNMVGYSADFLYRFATEYGYKLEIDYMDFGALLSSVATGRYDLAISNITITDERKEAIMFTDPYYTSDIVMAVLNGKKFNSLADFETATIGIMTGSVYDNIAKRDFPNAKRDYYTLLPDLFVAIQQEKVDGFITEIPYYVSAKWEGTNIDVIDEVIEQTNAGFIFKKDPSVLPLLQQLNAFILDYKEKGILDELKEKWFSEKEPTEFYDISTLTGENGTIKIALAPDLKPYAYLKNNIPTGYEIEILGYFAEQYGYKLDITYMNFDGILPGVVSGMYDMGVGGFTITEERKESVYFSESHLSVDVVMIVKSDEVDDSTLWEKITEGFEKTFIRENRWKLIVEGTGITLLISVFSAILGSLLGFGLYMLSRSSIKWLNKTTKGVAKVYTRIIDGTPVVVILMILFYVIFGSLPNISGIVVAIIGFALTFGAFVYKHLDVSVNSVDYGQTEAAYALGYTKNKTFFRIILPQSMSIFMPSYCGHIVELIKATAVVGYIAVTDLTKMGDIIRSNTYEAFFPLISTAVIYFMLTWLFTIILNFVSLKLDKKQRKTDKILKGVKTI